METKELSWLQIHQFKVLKIITIVSEENKELGKIVYTRNLNSNYNFVSNKEEDSIIDSYPSENIYPIDFIDKSIFEAIKTIYPNSFLNNDTIFFQTDLEKISTVTNRKKLELKIIFQPFVDYSKYKELRRLDLYSFEFNISLYKLSDIDSTINSTFFIKYDLEMNLYPYFETLSFE